MLRTPIYSRRPLCPIHVRLVGVFQALLLAQATAAQGQLCQRAATALSPGATTTAAFKSKAWHLTQVHSHPPTNMKSLFCATPPQSQASRVEGGAAPRAAQLWLLPSQSRSAVAKAVLTHTGSTACALRLPAADPEQRRGRTPRPSAARGCPAPWLGTFPPPTQAAWTRAACGRRSPCYAMKQASRR